MKDTNVKIDQLGGIFETYPQPQNSLLELENFQVNAYTQGWDNKLGYEKFYSPGNDWSPFTTDKVDSLFYVQRHQGAQDSILFEQGGKLYQLNDFNGIPDEQELSSGRNVPNTSELGTQYCQFGRYVLYCNGYDRPAKSHLWPCTSFTTNYLVEYPLGFDSFAPTPYVWDVHTNPVTATAAGDFTCIFFPQFGTNSDFKDKGLGLAETDKKNKYRYKVTFITTSGSESPISEPSNTVEWTTQSPIYKYALVVEMPVGNNDVVARRVYRTKNFSDDTEFDGDTFFFVAQVSNNEDLYFIDDVPDGGLGSQAPSLLASVPFPSIHCRYMGVYKNCLFIDGGRINDLALYFSNPTKPDQFSSLDFIMLGHRQGGSITGLYSYFNHLLVFRESSIDIIRGDYPNFVSNALNSNIGTLATNTIVFVPEFGVMFLSYDGVYTIFGNVEYGDNPKIENITPHLRDTFSRLNKDALCKASAVYSRKRKEYIVHFAVDGFPLNNFGLVFHTDKRVWSVRKNIPVGQMIVNMNGDVLFGMNDSAPTSNDEHGIMVLSARRSAGQSLDGDALVDNAAPTSIMRSSWLDMGDPAAKKKIHSVYLFIATGGDQDIPLDYYMDFDYNSINRTQALRQQRPDFADQEVYDKVFLDANKYWEEPLVTTVRYDVHSKACSHFQWKIETTADVHIIGYAVDFTAAGLRVIKGKKL
tara:strand:+ start:8591 stop:10681 length:2091 start_codon:yes stop_codon:yes gene_type:complete